MNSFLSNSLLLLFFSGLLFGLLYGEMICSMSVWYEDPTEHLPAALHVLSSEEVRIQSLYKSHLFLRARSSSKWRVTINIDLQTKSRYIFKTPQCVKPLWFSTVLSNCKFAKWCWGCDHHRAQTNMQVAAYQGFWCFHITGRELLDLKVRTLTQV